MGMGKTVSVLSAYDILRIGGEEDKPMLVLAPLRVANSVWPVEVKKWDHLKHLRVSVITGSPKDREAAVKRTADVYVINYENLPWLVEKLGESWPFGMVVADESTKLKSFRTRQGGKRARALAKFAHTKCTRWVDLTGTPSPNGLKDLWGQIWFLDAGERLGRTYTAFTHRWFQPSWSGFGIEPLPFAQEQIENKLSDICLSLDPKDYFDLEEPVVNIIETDLSPKAQKHYQEMEKQMFTELGEHGVEAVNAAARTMKCLQLANGAAYVTEDGEWEEVHTAKLDVLEDIVEEAAGMPVLVAYHFKSDLARLKARFKIAKVLDKKQKTIDDWNAGKIPILLAHPASAGHGLNLADGGNVLAFFSLDWNLENHQQIIERIGPVRQLQAGYDRPVFLHYITAKNTVDQLVLERLRYKRDIQDILMDAMNKK